MTSLIKFPTPCLYRVSPILGYPPTCGQTCLTVHLAWGLQVSHTTFTSWWVYKNGGHPVLLWSLDKDGGDGKDEESEIPVQTDLLLRKVTLDRVVR